MKRRSKIMKAWACFVLAIFLCMGSLSIGTAAVQEGDYTDEAQKDEVEFLSLVPEACAHESVGDWQLVSLPTETVAGSKAQMCTVCGTAVVTQELPCLKFKSAALALGENLTLDYKVSKELLATGGYTAPYAVFEMGGRVETVTAYSETDEYYVFPFSELSPYLMNDNIRATLYATCMGSVCKSAPQDYSIATYCYNALTTYASAEYAELRTLLVDLLNYGAAVQTYMNYRTDALVNADLTETQKGWGTATDRTLTSSLNKEHVVRDNATVAWKSVGLTLQDSIAIRFKIDATDVTGMYAKVFTSNGIRTIDNSNFIATEGGHYIWFDWLSAAQMSETVYITVYDQNGAVSNTLSYSVESYAAAQQASSNANLVSLVEAMIRYGDATKAYVNGGVTTPDTSGGGTNDQEGWTKPY